MSEAEKDTSEDTKKKSWRSFNIFFRFYTKKDMPDSKRFWHKLFIKIGPTWRAAPLRRIVQASCLILFLYLFFYVAWPYADHFDEHVIADKEHVAADLFLIIDPLVGLSTAIAGAYWGEVALWMLGILAICIVVPRMFCGWLCPLGTLIDLFDWAIGRHIKRWKLKEHKGWFVNIKWYLLAGVMLTSVCSVLTAGYFAAIPVVTRGLEYSFGRLQRGIMRGWHEVPPFDAAIILSLVLFAGVFLLGLFEKRFWCRYVCPSGATFSFFNLFRRSERKVTSDCISCNKCVQICPFDAIKDDFTTRVADCTMCQSCGGVCPTEAIQFTSKGAVLPEKEEDPETVGILDRPLARRGFITAGIAGLSIAGLKQLNALDVGFGGADKDVLPKPIRPPGSVPEAQFLDLCIRCAECFKACPGPVLIPAGTEYGIDSMWTPIATFQSAGCHQDCNFCTDVCPTGAIQPLKIEEKREIHMGLAKVNEETCLAFREEDKEVCDLCYQECVDAGYDAIEMKAFKHDVAEEDLPPPGMMSDDQLEEMLTYHAPIVDMEKCVGCGLCEYRCHQALVIQEPKLEERAIIVVAENEDRIVNTGYSLRS